MSALCMDCGNYIEEDSLDQCPGCRSILDREKVQKYLDIIKQSPVVMEYDKTLIIGNIRAFVGWVIRTKLQEDNPITGEEKDSVSKNVLRV